jgi:hypothetical protein
MLNEKSRELNLEVEECSEDVGEITALGGSGFRFMVNLNDKSVLVDNGRYLTFLANML